MAFDPRLWHINQALSEPEVEPFSPIYTPITRSEQRAKRKALRAMRFLARQAKRPQLKRLSSTTFTYGPGRGTIHMWPGRCPE